MDQVLLKLADQAPSVVALMIVVWFFLNYMKDMSIRHAETAQKLTEEFHRAHKVVADESTIVISRNTIAIDRNTEALGLASNFLRKQMSANGPNS